MVNPKMTDEEFEVFYNELFEEFGPVEGSGNAGKASVSRNGTRKYQGSTIPAYGGSMEKNPMAAPVKQKKRKSLMGLTICLCLECLGIVGVVLWWLLRIM